MFSDKVASCDAPVKPAILSRCDGLKAANSHLAYILELQRGLWQHPGMIEFRTLPIHHPNLGDMRESTGQSV